MNNNEIVAWIIGNIKENKTLDFLHVQNLIYHKQDLVANDNASFDSGDSDGHKRKYEQSLAISKLAVQTADWIHSKEGVEHMKKKGERWSNEDIGKNIFGWQKSFFYKLLKVGKLKDQDLIAFEEYCNRDENKKINRTIENLLKFVKDSNFADNTNKSQPESDFAKAKNIIIEEMNKMNTVDGNRLAENIIFRIDELMTLAH